MKDQDGTGRYLSTGEAARLLGVSRFTLLRAVRRGEIQPAHQTPGGYYRFDLATAQAYAACLAERPALERRRKSPPPAEHHNRDVRREERLSTLFATMASGVMVVTPAGRVRDLNHAARDVLGLPHTPDGAHVLGRLLAATWDALGTIVPEEERPIQTALRTGHAQRDVLVRVTRVDGVQRWLQVDAVPLLDAARVVQEVVVSFVDVTARQEAEAALRAQFESLPLPTYIWQRRANDWVLCDFNPAALRYSRGAMAGFLGHTAQECYHDRPDVLADFERCWTERRPLQRELSWTSPRTNAPIVLIVTYVFVAPDRIMVHTDDVTDQRAAEAALRASEARYRRLLETAQEGIWEIDATHCTTFVNEAMARMVGYTVQEMLGQPATAFMSAAERATSTERLARRRRGMTDRRQVGLPHKDGHEVPVWMAMNPLLDAQGAYVGSLALVTDLTEQIEAQEALHASEERYRALFERATDIVGIVDATGQVTYVSDAVSHVLGYLPQEMVGRQAGAFLHPDDRLQMQQAVAQLLQAPGTVVQVEVRLRHQDGSWRTFEAINRNCLDEPAIRGIVFNQRDITERRQAEAALRASEERFRALSEHATDLVSTIGADGTFQYLSPSWQRVMGYAPEELLGTNAFALAHPDDVARAQAVLATTVLPHEGAVDTMVLRTRHADGSWRTLEAVGNNRLHDPAVGGIVISARDITARVQAEERLRHQTLHDTLTGLPNRTLLFDRAAHALAVAERAHGSVALLLLDMNGFKAINDTFGHAYGDRVLRQVAARLQRTVRAEDTVARLSGDEFAILLADQDRAGAIRAAQRIEQAFAVPFVLEGRQFHLGASVGIALYPDHGSDLQTLLRRADTAMYASKRSGGGAVLYTAAHEQGIPNRLTLAEELRTAVQRGDLVLHYQPKVAVTTGAVTSVEALIRWPHPERGLIPPGQFIPLAEQTGLIVPLTRWVLEEAARQWAIWAASGQACPIAVNLSAANLQDPHLVPTITTILERGGMPAASLRLEVTESALLADATAGCAVLGQLRALGIGLSVDDYGSGYSSLAYLKHLPVDELKIDMAFVRHMATDARDAAIVASTVGLGHSLALQVVAEGVEDAATWELLRTMGCDVAQGYYLSRPLPADACTAWLQRVSGAA